MFKSEKLVEIKWEIDRLLEHPEALFSGRILNNDQYEIVKLEEITERAFVYKAIELSSGEFVSIKEFFPREAIGIQEQLYLTRNYDTGGINILEPSKEKILQFKNMIERFIEEAQYLEKISYGDPILRIVDSFKDYGTAYIVTNYNCWPSLHDLLLKDYIFTSEELEWISRQLIDIVIRFHRRGIVHRNVNPKNIYITPDEIIIDSLGTSDFIQDIKMYDIDAYDNKYYAPEVMMHSGMIGTWSDVYAIGKVLIDMISHMTTSGDYFDGLNTLDEKMKARYSEIIKGAIHFKSADRTQDAMCIKKILFVAKEENRVYKTPRSMIAMIALISFVSCMLVIWQYNNDTLLSNNDYVFQEIDTPLGLPNAKRDIYFITEEMVKFEPQTQAVITWFKRGSVEMKTVKVKGIASDKEYEFNLEAEVTSFDLNTLDLSSGIYYLILSYQSDQLDSIMIEFEILE